MTREIKPYTIYAIFTLTIFQVRLVNFFYVEPAESEGWQHFGKTVLFHKLLEIAAFILETCVHFAADHSMWISESSPKHHLHKVFLSPDAFELWEDNYSINKTRLDSSLTLPAILKPSTRGSVLPLLRMPSHCLLGAPFKFLSTAPVNSKNFQEFILLKHFPCFHA